MEYRWQRRKGKCKTAEDKCYSLEILKNRERRDAEPFVKERIRNNKRYEYQLKKKEEMRKRKDERLMEIIKGGKK